jgi:hypothetical protein
MKENAWQHLSIQKKNLQIVAHHHDKQEATFFLGRETFFHFDVDSSDSDSSSLQLQL